MNSWGGSLKRLTQFVANSAEQTRGVLNDEHISKALNFAQAAGSVLDIIGVSDAPTPTEGVKTMVIERKIVEGRDETLYYTFSKDSLKLIVAENPELIDNAHPDDGGTPLHYAARRRELDCVVGLVAYGADINRKDKFGRTPLHCAILSGSLPIVRLLICLDADLGEITPSIASSEEIASTLLRAQKWKQQQQLRPKSSKQQNSNQIEVILQQRAIEQKLKNPSKGKHKSHPLRLLSLDGGGIRGLVLAQALFEVEISWKKCRDSNNLLTGLNDGNAGSTFVQQNFDWIAGTSTGAILALGLTKGYSLLDCIRLYLRLKDEVFVTRSSPVVPYSADQLELLLRGVFGANTVLSQIGNRSCDSNKLRVFVTATRADSIPPKLELYRNYKNCDLSGQLPAEDMLIWKSARRSSAAPTFFPIADEAFLDGGLMVNNPSTTLFREVCQHIESRRYANEEERETRDAIAFVLSIGTGREPQRVVPPGSLDFQQQLQPQPQPIPNSASSSGAALFKKVEQETCATEGCSSSENDARRWNWFSFESFRPYFSKLSASTCNLLTLSNIFVEQLTDSNGITVDELRSNCSILGIPYFRFSPQLTEAIALDETKNEKLVEMLWTTKVYMNETCYDEMTKLVDLLRHFSST